MNYYAIIVAGGSGSRMKADIPKQFLPLQGMPVLMHTITAFFNSDFKPQIILVLHPDYSAYWAELCRTNNFTVPHQVVSGGDTRFQSVKNALGQVKDPSVVAVHDAVRPLIANSIITASFKLAEKYGTAVTAIKSRDSIRQVNGNLNIALSRETIFIIQTPQTFRSEIIRKAYTNTYQEEFTDDATVVEQLSIPIHFNEGSIENIKITFPDDMLIAESILHAQGK